MSGPCPRSTFSFDCCSLVRCGWSVSFSLSTDLCRDVIAADSLALVELKRIASRPTYMNANTLNARSTSCRLTHTSRSLRQRTVAIRDYLPTRTEAEDFVRCRLS